jgi:hypothetical protein
MQTKVSGYRLTLLKAAKTFPWQQATVRALPPRTDRDNHVIEVSLQFAAKGVPDALRKIEIASRQFPKL